ncbi:mas [Symbiodinium sp. KB8]|nr:mas [Symbiodinium sp. KB8]
MLFEMPADWVAMVPGVTHYQDLIIDEAKFMTRAGGRGLFYIFQGAIWACFASLVKLVHLVAAVAMLLVGTLHVLMQLLGAQTLQTLAGDNEVEPSFPFWRCFQSHDG